jgi:hypothetical protein
MSLADMTRLILKVIDLGASAVFMALCTKAFFVHLYKDTNPMPRRAPNPAHDQRSRAIVT